MTDSRRCKEIVQNGFSWLIWIQTNSVNIHANLIWQLHETSRGFSNIVGSRLFYLTVIEILLYGNVDWSHLFIFIYLFFFTDFDNFWGLFARFCLFFFLQLLRGKELISLSHLTHETFRIVQEKDNRNVIWKLRHLTLELRCYQ